MQLAKAFVILGTTNFQFPSFTLRYFGYVSYFSNFMPPTLKFNVNKSLFDFEREKYDIIMREFILAVLLFIASVFFVICFILAGVMLILMVVIYFRTDCGS